MRSFHKRSALLVMVCLAGACNDDSDKLFESDAGPGDASTPAPDAAPPPADGGGTADTGTPPAPRSLVPRPGAVDRPPTDRLPDDLKPPVQN